MSNKDIVYWIKKNENNLKLKVFDRIILEDVTPVLNLGPIEEFPTDIIKKIIKCDFISLKNKNETIEGCNLAYKYIDYYLNIILENNFVLEKIKKYDLMFNLHRFIAIFENYCSILKKHDCKSFYQHSQNLIQTLLKFKHINNNHYIKLLQSASSLILTKIDDDSKLEKIFFEMIKIENITTYAFLGILKTNSFEIIDVLYDLFMKKYTYNWDINFWILCEYLIQYKNDDEIIINTLKEIKIKHDGVWDFIKNNEKILNDPCFNKEWIEKIDGTN
jgi:hypothetical protein